MERTDSGPSLFQLMVTFKGVGTYRFFTEASKPQLFQMQSPEIIYEYRWDEQNGQWKSLQLPHFLDELLMRELATNNILLDL
mmetsp:Transcript_8605/g.13324  ORF Transcript_8605/g.13324 Transcript_8605/m.13324 type:complete len:82 (+) Transcript_8605:402-647(+)